MATQKDAELLVLLLRWATELGAEAAFAEIFSDGSPKEDAPISNPAVGKILTYGEAVGTFVKHGLLNKGLVNDFWLSSAVWDRLGPAVVRGREEVGEPEQHGCEDEAAAVDEGVLVVSGGQPAPMFEALEGAFDDVASAVGGAVVGHRSAAG